MAHIIPATVIVDKNSDGPPKLVVNQGGSDLGELITERGIEIQESGDFMDHSPGLDSDNHGSDPAESLVDEPGDYTPLPGRRCPGEGGFISVEVRSGAFHFIRS